MGLVPEQIVASFPVSLFHLADSSTADLGHL